jgi:hypothetical protein
MTRRKSIRQFLLTTITALGVALSLGTAPATAATPSWNQLPIPPAGYLKYLTAFSTTSAFGTTWVPCGETTCSQLWQLNGQTWSKFSQPTGFGAAAITGTSATDAWFLGGTTVAGIVYHWDGQHWVDRSPGVTGYYVQAATTVSPTSAFSAGVFYGSTSQVAGVSRWDGNAWTVTKLPQIAGEDIELTAVSAASPTDAWATGDQCTSTGNDRCQPYLVHWDGTRWSQVTVPSLTPRSALPQAVISRNGEVWIVGRETDLNGGTNPDRIFAEHWNGQSWTTDHLPLTVSADGFYSYVTGLAFHGTDLLAGVSHTLNEGVMDWNGSSWAPYPGPLTTTPTVNALVGTLDGQVFAAGNGTDATGTHDFLANLPA